MGTQANIFTDAIIYAADAEQMALALADWVGWDNESGRFLDGVVATAEKQSGSKRLILMRCPVPLFDELETIERLGNTFEILWSVDPFSDVEELEPGDIEKFRDVFADLPQDKEAQIREFHPAEKLVEGVPVSQGLRFATFESRWPDRFEKPVTPK